MKKSLLILGVTALVFAGCSDVDVKTEIQNDSKISEEAIDFASYTNKITRAENSSVGYDWTFYTHQPDFKVWAYKNPNTAYNTPVFSGQIIDAKSDGSFDYHVATDARFWDKSAATVYQFYAAAPANGGWTFVSTGINSYANQDKGYFTTTSTLSGVNLRDNTTDTENKLIALAEATSSFKGKDDVDKLIAAPCSGSYNDFLVPASTPAKHAVHLEFIHILSKMNVTVKKDAILDSKTVKLLKVEVCNLKNYGEFSEATAANPAGIYSRWTNQAQQQVSSADVKYTFDYATGVTLDKTNRIYFIESLVIPQATETEAVDYDGTKTPAVMYTLAEYNAAKLAEDANWVDIDDAAFNALSVAERTKTPAVHVYDAGANAAPYFMIQYTIDGELFTSYHNLATAFKPAAPATTLDFLEGFQNTLHINICPEKIEFCADVAGWDNNPNVTGVDVN